MTDQSDRRLIDRVQWSAHLLSGSQSDYNALMALVKDASFILVGEATHGTHEFYRTRAEITKRLIQEKGFNAVAVEADWPDAYRVNRYVRGLGGDRDPTEALADFKRFPTWMWRNRDVVDFVDWLRQYYAHLPDQFDAILHFDETTAVRPLKPAVEEERAPETYPSGV